MFYVFFTGLILWGCQQFLWDGLIVILVYGSLRVFYGCVISVVGKRCHTGRLQYDSMCGTRVWTVILKCGLRWLNYMKSTVQSQVWLCGGVISVVCDSLVWVRHQWCGCVISVVVWVRHQVRDKNKSGSDVCGSSFVVFLLPVQMCGHCKTGACKK